MLTYEEARIIGVNACVDKLGRSFVKKHQEKSCSAYGDREDFAFCFVGVSDRPDEYYEGRDLVLDDGPDSQFPYQVSCNVWYQDGRIEFLDCILPNVEIA